MVTNKPEMTDRPNPLRRKLFRGAAGGMGVMLAVQSKTALGQTVSCLSPSAKMSGNTSNHNHQYSTCSGGRSPGYWKVPQHFIYWRTVIPATVQGLATCSSGLQGAKYTDISQHGTSLNSIFPGAISDSAVGIWAVLAFQNNAVFGGQGELLRTLASAYLNASYFKGGAVGQYPVTPDGVKEMWLDLKTNGVYCPGPVAICTNGWSPATVISYIKDMYDFNDAVEPELCVP